MRLSSPKGEAVSVDVYKSHRFCLRWNDHHVAAFRRLAALSRTAEVVKIRPGNDPTVRKSSGTADYDPIAMEHGITVDADFETWANASWSGAAAIATLRRELSIDVFDERNHLVASYEVHRAWVSQFRPCPTSTRTPTLSPSSASASRTRAGCAYNAVGPPRRTAADPGARTAGTGDKAHVGGRRVTTARPRRGSRRRGSDNAGRF
jgi:phage tail-like protein